MSFRVQPSQLKFYATDDIGLCLSDVEPPEDDDGAPDEYFKYNPQIQNPEGNYLDDEETWYKISGQYKAVGNERYLIIGNFKTDSETTYIHPEGWTMEEAAYFFVDDVIVKKCPNTIMLDLPMDTSICDGSDLILNVTNPAATAYLWEDGSTASIRTISKPGDYVIQVSSGECLYYDTITVKVLVLCQA